MVTTTVRLQLTSGLALLLGDVGLIKRQGLTGTPHGSHVFLRGDIHNGQGPNADSSIVRDHNQPA